MTTTIDVIASYKELYNPKWRYLLYYGGRASGKSYATAEALLIRGRASRLRILCTREVQNTIKDSVHKLLADLVEKYNMSEYIVQKDSIVNAVTGTEFIFKGLKHNTNEIKSTEGIDICWVEEAQSITKESLDVLTPTIRKQGSQIIFTFNRFHELDPVFVEFVMKKPAGTYVKKVNYDVLEKVGLLPDVIKLEIEKDRETPELFNHKWLGEPIGQSEFSVISREKAMTAMQNNIEADGRTIIGVDVARMGSDRTVFWKRKGLKTVDYKIYEGKRTTEVCDLLERFIEHEEQPQIKVDDTGVGGGVTDEMIKRGYEVVAINFGAEAQDKNKYPNLISEAWFKLSEIIESIELPLIDELLMELTTRQWNQDTKGKRRIESKLQYKKRGFRSPDIADACIICYYEPRLIDSDDIFM